MKEMNLHLTDCRFIYCKEEEYHFLKNAINGELLVKTKKLRDIMAFLMGFLYRKQLQEQCTV